MGKWGKYSQAYKKDWENLRECKGWLVNNGEKAHCKVCRADLRPHLADLKKHGSTQKHLDLINVREGSSKDAFNNFLGNFHITESMKAKKFELQVWICLNDYPVSLDLLSLSSFKQKYP